MNRQRSPGRMSWTSALKPGMTVRTEKAEGSAPFYDLMHQGSVDAQWTLGALTLKAEGFARLWGDSLRAFAGGGAGVDYTFFKIVGEADLSFAGEFLFDTRPIVAAPTFGPTYGGVIKANPNPSCFAFGLKRSANPVLSSRCGEGR